MENEKAFWVDLMKTNFTELQNSLGKSLECDWTQFQSKGRAEQPSQ